MTDAERKEGRYQRRKAKRENKKRESIKEYDSYEKVFTFEHLYTSFYECRKNVRWKYSVQNYNINHLRYTWLAYKQLHGLYGCKYHFKGHNTFELVERGKRRKIAAVKLPDRVILKCFCTYSLTPALTRNLIYDNSASRKGMGTKHTRCRLERELQRAYRKWGRDFHIAITDCTSYFDSLLHDVIKGIIKETYTDKMLIAFAIYCLNQEGEGGKGLGLGCQPNQMYAISYLNKVDHAMCRRTKYKRYMDDAIMIAHEKETLKRAVETMTEACGRLGIKLHEDKTQIIPATHEFTYLKTTYRILENGRIVKTPWKKNLQKTRRKLKLFRRLEEENKMSHKDTENFYKSFIGNMKEYSAHKILKEMARFYNKVFQGRREKHVQGICSRQITHSHSADACLCEI
jgi:hypothetical protein